MRPTRIQSQPISGQRLDRAVGTLLASPETTGVEQLHLRRLRDTAARTKARFRAAGPSQEGLSRILDDHLMPRLQDPSILQRDRFIAILRQVETRLERASAVDGDRLAAVARAVLDREISRTENLRARSGEILEG